MQMQIMACDCTECMFVVVKQAGADGDKCPRWELPWFARRQGANYQDLRYGLGRRLHSKRIKDGKHKGWTCTVCGREKSEN
jgi:hypothetical protein